MTVSEPVAPSLRSATITIGIVWVVSALGAVLVSLFAQSDARMQWYPIVLAVCLILSFCLQLSLDSKVGFVNRLSVSVGGAVAILAIATVVAVVVPSA
ncbi:hypothetical protein [Homoserinimonas hongtaonis]|uniref:Uncharacterized protein n=1 Tax=Homoserinimonas hongtaonis TaxID=2079791 RepID=A0A2U1T2Q5_9MICO|nr:hypothetical protein [Salinibacterium hongtaonis]AWB88407.1 hypothetical protein C2138_01555 [Salinibacterium hongtaonis]PWB98165.1 hypothetical protein DF220_10250 [Salinibacterium hongtaonis]